MDDELLEQAIIAVVRRQLTEVIFTGTVEAVDKDQLTCRVRVEGDLIRGSVRLVSALGTKGEIIVMYPKVGSVVTCALLDGSSQSAQVVGYTIIDEFNMVIDSQSYLSNKDGHVFNGGELGGMTITPELKTQLDKNNMILDVMLQVFQGAPIPEPGSGANSAFQTALKLATEPLQMGDFSNIENDKVKH